MPIKLIFKLHMVVAIHIHFTNVLLDTQVDRSEPSSTIQYPLKKNYNVLIFYTEQRSDNYYPS